MERRVILGSKRALFVSQTKTAVAPFLYEWSCQLSFLMICRSEIFVYFAVTRHRLRKFSLWILVPIVVTAMPYQHAAKLIEFF